MKQIFILLLALPFLLLMKLFGFGRRDMVFLKDDHPDMDAAFRRARETLPHFLAKFREAPATAGNFCLKVRFATDGGGTEHIWVENIECLEDGFRARLANDPNSLPRHKLGDTVLFATDRVSDWAYAVNGVYHGHFTTRALLRHMSRGVRQQTLAMLGWEAGVPEIPA